MPMFRKKPVVIEAVEWNGNRLSEVPEWLSQAIEAMPGQVGSVVRVGDNIHIPTLEGTMIASPGDWIIRGVKADIFAATYEPA
jgi:hypothetical protein